MPATIVQTNDKPFERVAIDPVTLQVLANHAQAAAEAMAFTLFRTAHSTFVKETEDFTSGLTTPDGRFTILMPHPERGFRTVQHSWHPDWAEDAPWMRMFRNARKWVG